MQEIHSLKIYKDDCIKIHTCLVTPQRMSYPLNFSKVRAAGEMVEHGVGGQGAVGSISPGFPVLQHPFSLTKAAAVAAVCRCGKVLQVGESCHSVWGAATLKLFFSSAISSALNLTDTSLYGVCLFQPSQRTSCLSGRHFYFLLWRGESWRPCSYFQEPLCSVCIQFNLSLVSWVTHETRYPPLPLPSPSTHKLWAVSPDLLHLMHFDYFRAWVLMLVGKKSF